MSYPIEIRKERAAFITHKHNAAKRGIGFEISFEEWLSWWKTDDRWDRRGRGRGRFVMARHNDVGPYRIGNVFCATVEDNSHRWRKGRTLENTPECAVRPRSPDADTFPRRLSAAMATLRWGVSSFAGAARVSDRTVQRWLATQNEPPEALVAWVERLAVFLRDNPAPPPGRTRRNA